MFVKLSQKADLFQVPQNFASLRDVDEDGNLHLDLVYSFSQKKILQHEALLLQVSIFSEVVKTPDLSGLASEIAVNDNEEILVQNALTLVSKVKNNIKANERLILASFKSDLTAKMNNELVRVLKNDPTISDNRIVSFTKQRVITKKKKELSANDAIVPMLVRPKLNDESITEESREIKELMHECVFKHGVDPSLVSQAIQGFTSAKDSLGGHQQLISEPAKKSEVLLKKISTKLLKNEEQPASSADLGLDDLVYAIDSVSSDEVNHRLRIIIPKERLSSVNAKQVFVKFELLRANNLPLQTISRRLNLFKHLQIYHTPIVSPVVSYSRSEMNDKVNLQITQRDRSARAIRVFQRLLRKSSNEIFPYEFLGEFELDKKQAFRNLTFHVGKQGVTLFRIVSVGLTGTISHTFTNVVVPPRVSKRRVFTSLISKITSTGVEIEIRELPSDVISFRVLRRDVTIHDAEYQIVDPLVTTQVTRDTSVYVVRDVELKPFHVYHYTCDLVYREGDVVRFGHSIVEYVPLVENLINLEITNLQTIFSEKSPDVTFNIVARVLESDLDVIKKLLEKQNLANFFSDELLRERTKLQGLLAHHVKRLNLNSGQVEDFGIITDDTFSDEKFRNINGVSPLVLGQKYRYEISTLLRSPETLFDDFEKSATDITTKKTYKFKPAKFLHPLALSRGNITDKITQKAHYGKQQMAFGSVGNLTTVDVSMNSSNVRLNEATASYFDDDTNVISWKTTGTTIIDHFLIMIENMKVKSIIGRAHSNTGKSAYEFVHNHKTGEFLGEVKYIIVPVLGDYTVGASVETNGVMIG